MIAGNTIMMHLLLGFDPSSIRRDPYVPTTTIFSIFTAVEIGLNVHPSAPLYLFPAASGYVGGDVTAGLLATGIPDRDELTILVDIGTNGETVLGIAIFCWPAPAQPAQHSKAVGWNGGWQPNRGRLTMCGWRMTA